jgi:hypothetical protein
MRSEMEDCGEPKSVVWSAAVYVAAGLVAERVRTTVVPSRMSIS